MFAHVRALLCGLFFLSGASALLFETLWFRGAGLALGNGVWASTVVLSAFMAGLALGNALAVRRADGLRRPLVAYGILELVVGLSGLAIVLALPRASAGLASVAGAALDQPVALNALRLLLAFALLVIPATAMGMTLPTVVRAHRGDAGAALGSLYGWNTLGAVAGALLGETLLIEHLGVPGTAVVAAGLDLLAAGIAVVVGRRLPPLDEPAPAAPEPTAPAAPVASVGRGVRRLLLAAALAGGALLALEVLWFRHLLLFALGTSTVFAALLSIVLLGIGGGGLAGGWWLTRRPDAHRHVAVVALAAGAATSLALRAFDAPVGARPLGARDVFVLAAPLIFPTAFLSGVLFTWLGAAVHARAGQGAARAVARLTLWNTTGAIVGSALAGLALLPALGVGRGLLLVVLVYGIVALACGPARDRRLVVGVGAWALGVALFPAARLRAEPLASAARYVGPGAEVVAVHEGLNETVAIVRQDLLGQPLSHRLVTNGYSMAANDARSRRYMELFALLPQAAHPELRDACLVCYGTGSTAAALVRDPRLRRLDVIDISPDVLELDAIVRPARETSPLTDPRVTVHVEDGRFFLAATRQEYDLITAEPPPPKLAGVVNLYTREYFELVRARLRPGGFCTHWLPVHSLSDADSRAIVSAFLRVFPDATLWNGAGLDWVLVGRRDPPAGPLSLEGSTHPWSDPRSAEALRSIGFDGPDDLARTLLADTMTLMAIAANVPPLEDAFPMRLSPDVTPWPWDPFDWIGGRDAPLFTATFGPVPGTPAEARALLDRPGSRTPLLWLLGSGVDELAAVDVARGATGPEVERHLGARAFVAGEYAEAARRWLRLPALAGHRALALELADK